MSPLSAAPATRSKAAKYEVCHRTNAIKNPYRRITVAWSAVDSGNNGHNATSHDGPVFNTANPTGSHGTTPRDSGLGSEAGGSNNRWGDIFNVTNGNQSNSRNWPAGQAIFDGTAGGNFTIGTVTKQACQKMSVAEFIKAEKEENPNLPMSTIMEYLDDQGATEDEALRQSLGGDFSNWYTASGNNSEDPNAISAALAVESPAVTTEPPTAVSANSATLNGTISPKGAAMVWYFEWSTSSNFTSPVPNETSGTTRTGLNTTESVSSNVTGLTSGTTYYYRTVGVVSNGLNGDALVETYLYGVIKQFVFGAPEPPTITSLTCGNTKITVAFTANANVTNVTGYEYSVDGGAYVNSGLSGSASGSFDITGLTNGVEVLVAIRAITASVKGIDSVAVSGTPCGAPSAVTDPATNVQNTSATINGTVSSNGASTAVTFTWGLSSTLASGNNTETISPNLSSTASGSAVSVALSGLTPGTTYYFRVNASNTGGSANGSILSFATPSSPPPTVTTEPATSVTTTTATINGTGTSNGATSTVTFTWGLSSTLASGNTTVTISPTLASNASGSAVSSALTGLTAGTTYYFRTTITNTNGTANGIIRSFTTETPISPSSGATTTTVAPVTSTVAPTTSTPTTVAPASNNEIGRVIGTAWFDNNRNNKRDNNEPLLASLPIQLIPTGVTAQAFNRVRKTALSLTTGSDGSFDFTTVTPGTYRILGDLPSGYGIDKSWDSSGNDDWTVNVTVVAAKIARGDFAAVGDATVTGCYSGRIEAKQLDATWNGFDKKLGTVDDATFSSKIGTDCNFELPGLPNGKFEVAAKASDGTVVSKATMAVTPAGGSVQTASLSVKAKIQKVLPQTGSSQMSDLMLTAMYAIAGGVAIVATSRRRRRLR